MASSARGCSELATGQLLINIIMSQGFHREIKLKNQDGHLQTIYVNRIYKTFLMKRAKLIFIRKVFEASI